MKRAFTLIEVNLAMLIMAGGVLSVVGLYAFGFRENRQSREDVASAAIANAVISPLVMAISANTNIDKIVEFQSPTASGDEEKGWGAYLTGSGEDMHPIDKPTKKAQEIFDSVIRQMGGQGEKAKFPDISNQELECGLVVTHVSAGVIGIGFRVTRKPRMLLSMPLYYTEVRCQGISCPITK